MRAGIHLAMPRSCLFPLSHADCQGSQTKAASRLQTDAHRTLSGPEGIPGGFGRSLLGRKWLFHPWVTGEACECIKNEGQAEARWSRSPGLPASPSALIPHNPFHLGLLFCVVGSWEACGSPRCGLANPLIRGHLHILCVLRGEGIWGSAVGHLFPHVSAGCRLVSSYILLL